MTLHGKEDMQPPGFAKPEDDTGTNTQVYTFPSLFWLITPRAFQTWTFQLQTAGGHLEKKAFRYASVDC